MRANLAIMFKFSRQMADCPTQYRTYSTQFQLKGGKVKTTDI